MNNNLFTPFTSILDIFFYDTNYSLFMFSGSIKLDHLLLCPYYQEFYTHFIVTIKSNELQYSIMDVPSSFNLILK